MRRIVFLSFIISFFGIHNGNTSGYYCYQTKNGVCIRWNIDGKSCHCYQVKNGLCIRYNCR